MGLNLDWVKSYDTITKKTKKHQKNEKAPKMKKTKQETLHKIGVFYKIAKKWKREYLCFGS